jgi:hypothetical protein
MDRYKSWITTRSYREFELRKLEHHEEQRGAGATGSWSYGELE